MKPVSIILFAALFAVSAVSQAAERGNCSVKHRGRCPDIPAPPAPPVPPVPPAPPAPPPMPEIPDQAHDACKGKKIGAALTFSFAKSMTMKGTCQQDSQGMYFELSSLTSD